MVLGISFDPTEANQAFARKHDFPFRLLSDADHTVGLAYRACENTSDAYARRYTYVIGPDGRIERSIDTKDPAGQAAAILSSLD